MTTPPEEEMGHIAQKVYPHFVDISDNETGHRRDAVMIEEATEEVKTTETEISGKAVQEAKEEVVNKNIEETIEEVIQEMIQDEDVGEETNQEANVEVIEVSVEETSEDKENIAEEDGNAEREVRERESPREHSYFLNDQRKEYSDDGQEEERKSRKRQLGAV